MFFYCLNYYFFTFCFFIQTKIMNASHPHSQASIPNILLLAIVLVVLVCLPFLITPNQKTLFSFPKFRAEADSSDVIAPFTENRKFK